MQPDGHVDADDDHRLCACCSTQPVDEEVPDLALSVHLLLAAGGTSIADELLPANEALDLDDHADSGWAIFGIIMAAADLLDAMPLMAADG